MGLQKLKESDVGMLKRLISPSICGLLVLGAAVGCQAPTTSQSVRSAPVKEELPEPPSDPLHPWLRMETSLGDIIFELDAEEAPTTVINFVEYAEGGEFDGTIFHRVVPDAILQGGAYTSDLEHKPRTIPQVVPDNWHIELHSTVGTIGLVRRSERFGKGTPDFFINLRDNVHHEMGNNHGRYAVFGRVVGGHDTVNRIRNTPLDTHPKYARGYSAVVPVEPVVINSARLISRFDPEMAREVIAKRYPDPTTAVRNQFGEKAAAGLVATGSGLMYVDITVGNGPRSPGPDDVIEFQYRGTFLNGTEFESTFSRNPAVRTMSALRPGIREALGSMTEGGVRVAVIPPELAYGSDGIPGIIPASSTLIFQIELLEIK